MEKDDNKDVNKKHLWKTRSNKILKAIVFVLLGAVITAAFFIESRFHGNQASISDTYVMNTLKEASELTSAELTYNGYAEYQDEGGWSIPFLNRKDFLMIYNAKARAGIDLSQVKCSVDNELKTVTLTVPSASILDVKVDPGSIKYYDEKFAPFNFDDKEDANRAQKIAEEKAMEELKDSGILEMADKQAQSLLTGILRGVVSEDYTFEFIPAKEKK